MGDYEQCPRCGLTFLSLDGDGFDNVVVTIELGEDDEPNARSKMLEKSGYEGYGKVCAYGQLTFKQRQGFLRHLSNYANLLLEEYKNHYEFDREWKGGD